MRSLDARARVVEARARQLARGGRVNAQLTTTELRTAAALDHHGDRLLARAYETGQISARGHHRVLRVARTIADLAGRDRVAAQDVAQALGLRMDDTAETAAA
jgi:magnesium chelatase family protein